MDLEPLSSGTTHTSTLTQDDVAKWTVEQVVKWARTELTAFPNDTVNDAVAKLKAQVIIGVSLIEMAKKTQEQLESKFSSPPYNIPDGPATKLAAAIHALRRGPAQQVKSWNEILSTVSLPKVANFSPTLEIVTMQEEGIRLDGSTFITFRNDTVKNICSHLRQNNNSLLIRAPPYSGKTSLCQLLTARFQEVMGVDNVLHCSLLGARSFNDIESFFKKVTPNNNGFSDWATRKSPTLIILDELQILYTMKSDPFWEWLKKSEQVVGSNVKLICFALYNSPRFGGDLSSPWKVPKEATLGLKDILLSTNELDEIIIDFNTRNRRGLEIDIDSRNIIKEVTGNHMGFASRLISLVYSGNITQANLSKFLRQREFADDLFLRRGVPRFSEMTPGQLNIINHLLTHRFYVSFSFGTEVSDEIKSLVKHGALVADESEQMFSFPCSIIKYCAQIYLAQETRPPHDNITSVAQLLQHALAKFNPKTIQNSIGTSQVDTKQLEVVWCMEFYRCACACLAKDTFISPSVQSEADNEGDVNNNNTTNRAQKGWVDFVVNSQKWWLIEFLREGNQTSINNHLNKFDTTTGRYRSLMKSNQIWAVVDFRTQPPVKKHPNLFSVVYTPDFLSYIVYCNSDTPKFVVNVKN